MLPGTQVFKSTMIRYSRKLCGSMGKVFVGICVGIYQQFLDTSLFTNGRCDKCASYFVRPRQSLSLLTLTSCKRKAKKCKMCLE